MKFDNILINGPKEAKNILLLAHGAGAPMDSLFMNTISDGLNKNGIITIRFEFPYMAKKRLGKNTFPDKFDELCTFYNKIYLNIKKINPNKNIWLGGKSMGGRVSAVISRSLDIKGVIVFGSNCNCCVIGCIPGSIALCTIGLASAPAGVIAPVGCIPELTCLKGKPI